MKRKYKYILIVLLTFIVYGNTLFHDYALDDAIVITDNEYTLQGFQGIKHILSEDLFSGFFDQKGKKLVAGGRYRPLSLVTFAIEWELIMGSPFDGLNNLSIQKRMNKNANPNYILPSNKLLKDLSVTIHNENRSLRIKQQENRLNKTNILTQQEKIKILSNLKKMQKNRKILLFVSHFINVLLFVITCLVLLILLERLFPSKETVWYTSISFVAVLTFLVHPIHTEVLANIKGRDEILSLLGALSSMLFMLNYIDSRKIINLLWAFVCFALALFSKEVAVTFLVITPLSIYFYKKSENKLKDILISLIPLVLVSVIYFIARNIAVGEIALEPSLELMNNSFLGMTFSERYATIFHTLLLYLKLLIFPHPLTYDYYPYHISIMTWKNITPILSVLIYVGMGVYAIIGLKKKNLISFGILFYLITLSPTSNVLFPIGVFMNERFVYASSIGIILIVAYLIVVKLPQLLQNQKIIIVLFLSFLSLYSIKTISRNRVWENDFTLFTHDVEISENSAKSNTSAGGKLIEEAVKPENKELRNEYLQKSIFYLGRAIKIHPTYNDAYLLMGNAQWELNHNLDSVFKYYNHILKRNLLFNQVYSNIFDSKINLVFEDGNIAKSNIAILHQLEKYNPNHFKLNYYLGKIYGRFLNDLNTSKFYLERAAKINPNDVAVFKDLGVAYGLTKEFKKSAIALTRAVELDSFDPVLKLNLAMTYANLKDFNNALKWMNEIKSMDIEKADAKILINLAYLYRNMGKNEKSQECFAQAQSLNPDLFKND
ncbi:MAG: hypothetical protein JEY96_15375 [Bacteroidales bacterium]|nr:hypothetical protein [Bacteroidales bacterium]